MRDPVFEEIKNLITEQQNPDTVSIDQWDKEKILEAINREDRKIAEAVKKEIPNIKRAVDIYVRTIKRGNRVFYIGAGTSGRLGVLDAAELWPTFGLPHWQVQGIIAGGFGALIRAQEGAEDEREGGKNDLKERGLTKKDFVIGIAASKRTPYVLGALSYAREIGSSTALITVVRPDKIDVKVDVLISPITGPEVILGSTRMKSGTACKMVLNMISTTSMILLGKVYKNFMVDLEATSKKLEERSKRILMMVTGIGYDEAARVLKDADGKVKRAIVMIFGKVDKKEADRVLMMSDGYVRKALEIIESERIK